MKRTVFVSLVGFFVGLILCTSAFSLEPYDDFSGTSIDLTKWRSGEFIREIRDFGAGGQKLLLARSGVSPLAIGSYNDVRWNSLSFTNPDEVHSIQASVTVLESDISGSGNARARLEGRWYNDGTTGGGYAGDIWAEINIWASPSPTGLKGWWYVGRYTGASDASLVQLGAGDFTQDISPDTAYNLYIAYDGTNKFTFRIGSETIPFSSGPTRAGDAHNPWKALTVRTQINNADSSCFISATFDNVYKNESLYDGFSSPTMTIDSSKWNTYEYVTEISGGKLRAKARSSADSPPGININNILEIAYPLGINTIQANVTPLAYQNPQGLFQFADISGAFYNDGSGTGGIMGDVAGQVAIGGSGSTPAAMWRVYRYTSSDGSTSQLLGSGVFGTPVVLGNVYTFYLSWSGSEFTFMFNDEVARYKPATSILPAERPFRRVRTAITPQVGKTEATIEALFDVFKVGYVVPNDNFSEAFIDEGKWKNGEFVREIDSGSHRLILDLASPNPIVSSSFPYSNSNQLSFSDPKSVHSMAADVTLLAYDLRYNAYTRARLGGRWYNNGQGTPGSDMTGDIWAEVALREDPSGVYAAWGVSKFTNADGTTTTGWGGGNFTTPITAGTPHTYTLYIGYDSTANRFTFRVGLEEYTFVPSGPLTARVRDPNLPSKGPSTRVQINDDESFGYVAAAFDNVYANGALYDSFSSPVIDPMIDPAKWSTYEFAREISDGEFRSKVRSGSASTAHINSSLESVYPTPIHSMRAKVTPTLYQNNHELEVLARIGGIFYHDGTPGTGYKGDVAAGVRIGGYETTPEARWQVQRYTDDTGQSWEVLADGLFSTPIILGNTYTLFMDWDWAGGQFTFRFENEEAHYTPLTVINPPNIPAWAIGSRINNPAGKEAIIEASYDDVVMNAPQVLVDISSVEFGDVLVGGTSVRTVTIINPGDGWLEIWNPVGPNPPFEVIDSTTCPTPPYTLDPGASCTLVVRLSPTGAGAFTGSLSVDTNDPDHPTLTIPLHGTGVAVLTVNKEGFGHGTITSSPPGINCGLDCEEEYTTVTGVTLTALPSLDSNFVGWSGGGCSGTGTCTITTSNHVTVTATFDIKTYPLNVTKAGTGTGTVSSGDGKINCGSDCTEIYTHGTGVALTANPDTGFVFAGWSGGGCTGTAPCTVTMDGAKTITATFSRFLVNPDRGTYGTQITITGSGFGSKKNKVLFGTVALKVVDWSLTTIHATLGKAMVPDTYDVTVIPKEPKGVLPITESDAFEVKLPEIDSVDPNSGHSDGVTVIKIEGSFFGTKKGKVYLQNGALTKACKVTTWSDTDIQFVVPKKLPLGFYDVTVTNVMGSVTKTKGFEVK